MNMYRCVFIWSVQFRVILLMNAMMGKFRKGFLILILVHGEELKLVRMARSIIDVGYEQHQRTMLKEIKDFGGPMEKLTGV